jgi:hypothetical protein
MMVNSLIGPTRRSLTLQVQKMRKAKLLEFQEILERLTKNGKFSILIRPKRQGLRE